MVRSPVKTPEELIGLVNEGWKIYPDNVMGGWRLKRGNKSKRVDRSLDDLARELYARQRLAEGAGGSEGDRGDAPQQPRGGRAGGAGAAEVLRVLGEEYASVIKAITEKTRWFTDALINIGWYSTMMAFQYVRVDPKDIPLRVAEFADQNEFVKFVVTNLANMIEVHYEGAEALRKREQELTRCSNILKVMTTLAAGWRTQAEELGRSLQIAQAIISRYGLFEEYLHAIAQYTTLRAVMNVPTPAATPREAEAPAEVRKGE